MRSHRTSRRLFLFLTVKVGKKKARKKKEKIMKRPHDARALK